VNQVKRDGGRPPVIALVAALFCVVVAVGAGLQGQFSFAGPLWTPGVPQLPAVLHTQQPRPAATAGAPHHQPVAQSGIVLNWVPILIVLGLLAVAVIIALVWLWRRRHPRSEKIAVPFTEMSAEDFDPQREIEPDLPTLQRGLALAGAILDADREPKDAIVRAWIGLQEAAEDSGVRRRAAETPTEFTARVFSAVDADRKAADTLLAIYLRVRFGTRPATASDRSAAREAVERLTATWPIEAAK
jgi:flagellar basal body-associated protein FliL